MLRKRIKIPKCRIKCIKETISIKSLNSKLAENGILNGQIQLLKYSNFNFIQDF